MLPAIPGRRAYQGISADKADREDLDPQDLEDRKEKKEIRVSGRWEITGLREHQVSQVLQAMVKWAHQVLLVSRVFLASLVLRGILVQREKMAGVILETA